MITGKTVSASLSIRIHWNQINWQRCEKNTRRLQARIVQATKEKLVAGSQSKGLRWLELNELKGSRSVLRGGDKHG
jgi:hypothetical protein